MTVFVDGPGIATYVDIDGEKAVTVGDLRQDIATLRGAGAFKMLFGGQDLLTKDDAMTLADVGICSETTIKIEPLLHIQSMCTFILMSFEKEPTTTLRAMIKFEQTTRWWWGR